MRWSTLAVLTFGISLAWADGIQRAPAACGFADGRVGAIERTSKQVESGRTGINIYVYPSSAPNAYGSPSWTGYVGNALHALENNLASVGDRSTDPNAYERAPAYVLGGEIAVTTFHSWRGIVEPSAPFQNELGNRMHFGLHIVAADPNSTFTLQQLTFELHSSDPWDSLIFQGDFVGWGYSATRKGINWGLDGQKGGGDDIVYTSGNGDMPVHEIVYVGVGNAWWPGGDDPNPGNPAGGKQKAMDDYFAWLASIGPIRVTCTYALTGTGASGTAAVTVLPPAATYTVAAWGPKQFPGPYPPPPGVPHTSYPGDTVEFQTYSGTLDLEPNIYTKKLNTLLWDIDWTYNDDDCDPSNDGPPDNWPALNFPFNAARGMWFGAGGPGQTGTLHQSGLLRVTWFNDYLGVNAGSATTFFLPGYKIKVTPAMLPEVGGSNFSGNPPWHQPNRDVQATFEVIDLAPDGALVLVPNKDCYDVNEPVTVQLWMFGVSHFIVGGQFFLQYNNTLLQFVSADPMDPNHPLDPNDPSPFTFEMYEFVDANQGTIDYGVNIPPNDPNAAVYGSYPMAILTFTARGEICSASDLITWRSHNPPTRLSNSQGEAISPLLENMNVLDTTPPVIVCPPDATVECNASRNPDSTGWATATDNCDPAPLISYSDYPNLCGCGGYTGQINRVWTATDHCGNSSQCVQRIIVQDTTPPAITCPENTTIECDKFPLGWARGGVLVMYNNYGPENPNSQAWFRAQYSQANTDGAIFNFEPGPWGYGASHPFQVIPDQFGLDFTLPAPTYNGTNPPLVWFTAVDNVNGTCAGASSVGPVAWAISGYTPPIPDPAACPVNSLLRSATPPAPGQVVVTQWSATQNGTVWTVAVEGYLVSDGYVHWYTPGLPDTPMSNFGWNGQFHFRGVLKYNSQGDPGNDGDFYNGALVLYANSLPPSTGWATATDNCDPGPIITFSDTYTPGTCGYTGTIHREWKATDRCGNFSTCTQQITVVDTTAPTFTYVPADRTVNADAGGCTAVLDPPLGMATATDNCDPNVQVTYVRSDDPNKALADPYPAGTTTITWTARDCSGNQRLAYTTVTVNAVNELQVTVSLAGTVASGSFTRCIRFELWNCPASSPAATVDAVLSFTNGTAGPVTIEVPCGQYNCITARDRLHTLRRTADSVDAGTYYTANFTGTDALIGGNLNDDFWVDILDFGVFSWQWGWTGDPNTTCTTPYPHADINGDGLVDTADFTFIQANFLLGHEANCCGAPGFRGEDEAGPLTRIAVADLARYGLEHLAVADLNGDGWIDEYDVAAFASGVLPQPQPKPLIQVDGLMLSPVPVEAEEK